MISVLNNTIGISGLLKPIFWMISSEIRYLCGLNHFILVMAVDALSLNFPLADFSLFFSFF